MELSRERNGERGHRKIKDWNEKSKEMKRNEWEKCAINTLREQSKRHSDWPHGANPNPFSLHSLRFETFDERKCSMRPFIQCDSLLLSVRQATKS